MNKWLFSFYIRIGLCLTFLSTLLAGCQENASESSPQSVSFPTPIGEKYSAVPTMEPDQLTQVGPKSQSTTSPTLVPNGIMLLLDYPPLIMTFDPAHWRDHSKYTDLQARVNHLQALSLETCSLGVLGPSGFFPEPDETRILGQVRYQYSKFSDQPPGSITAYYIEDESLVGYNYQIGLPKLTVQASPFEWEVCKSQAEEVLASLQVPLE